MRITTTTAYQHHKEHGCMVLNECDRLYCPVHRLLYQACETAEWGIQGDNDVVGGVAPYVNIPHDCPACERDAEKKKIQYMALTAVN